jgi:predicted DNA-binding transcriptional regulator AlpA
MDPKNKNDELLRFADLRSAKIVSNHVTLKRWIEERGFPPGFWMGRNTQVWWKSEIYAWLVNRPTARGSKH